MRRVALALLPVLAGCASTAPTAPLVQRVPPRRAASLLYYRQTTVETCDGRTLHGQIFTSRGDSLDLRPGPKVAWTNLRTMTATRGRSPVSAIKVLGGGAVLTALSSALAAATSPACGEGCDYDERGLRVATVGTLGLYATLISTAVAFRRTPKRVLRFDFTCPVPPPPTD